jgi:hypothetical protein
MKNARTEYTFKRFEWFERFERFERFGRFEGFGVLSVNRERCENP